jgi:hypothetical protein
MSALGGGVGGATRVRPDSNQTSGLLYSRILDALSSLSPSGSAPLIGACESGVMNTVDRDAMNFKLVDSCL